MNLVLLLDEDFITPDTVRLEGDRHTHIVRILKAKIGDVLTVGKLNGLCGEGTIVDSDPTHTTLTLRLHKQPPPPAPISIVLALPRPKMLKRLLVDATTLGVKNIYLINSYKVEKSYWQSPALEPKTLQRYLSLGLSQAKDTVLPRITFEKLFKPFVEDRLPALVSEIKQAKGQALLAHPTASKECPRAMNTPTLLAIGPEGGFTEYETTKLETAGFTGVTLGPRILRVETAVSTLLGRLL